MLPNKLPKLIDFDDVILHGKSETENGSEQCIIFYYVNWPNPNWRIFYLEKIRDEIFQNHKNSATAITIEAA